MGGTKAGATPRRRRMMWIRARPGAPVSVGEGVDGLELGVGDRSLHERRVLISVDVDREVFEEPLTNSAGGGTNTALQGLYELPPIQFCSSRMTPPSSGVGFAP
jgi:hypothetical protein